MKADSSRIERFTRWLYRYRGETAAPFAVILLVLARPTWGRLAVGLFLVMLGECLRLWAASHIGTHARGRTFRAPTGGMRARTGPYRLIPHPLYAGNLIVCLGLLVAARAGEPWFPALFLVVFCVQYSLFMRYEGMLIRSGPANSPEGPANSPDGPANSPGDGAVTPAVPPATLMPALTRAGFALEWPTLRTVMALSLVLVGLAWWWSPR
ncbi:MAG TPA: methyltransferase [Candidatus Eisenbacteria bacterium]